MPPEFYLPSTIVSAFPGFLTVSFSDTIGLGTVILGIALSAATLVGIIYGVKWKVAYEVETKTREAAEAFGQIKDDESKALHEQLVEALKVIGEQKAIIERFEALPNLERILHVMGEQAVRQDAAAVVRLQEGMLVVKEAFKEAMKVHDENAEARTDKVITAIQQTAAERRAT